MFNGCVFQNNFETKSWKMMEHGTMQKKIDWEKPT
jgi:hypothetical protein